MRYKTNMLLLQELERLIVLHSDLRFSQILQSYGFVKPLRPHKDALIEWQNEYYIEPQTILDRVMECITNIDGPIVEDIGGLSVLKGKGMI